MPTCRWRFVQIRSTPSSVSESTPKKGVKRARHPGMTTYLPLWLKKGFTTSSRNKGRGKTKNGEAGGKEIKNLDLIKHLLVLLQRRKPKAGVRFKYVAGHSGVEGNEEADVSSHPSRCWAEEMADRRHRGWRREERCYLLYQIEPTGLIPTWRKLMICRKIKNQQQILKSR